MKILLGRVVRTRASGWRIPHRFILGAVAPLASTCEDGGHRLLRTERTDMFNPTAFLLFASIVTVLALAVGARQGTVDPWLAIAGAIAVVSIELLMTLGPVFRRARSS